MSKINNGISIGVRRTHADPVPASDDHVLRVLKPKTTVPAKQDRVLIWHDDYRKIDRVLRWQGPCLGCGTQTWEFDDGDNDPRGMLGDSAQCGVDLPVERDPQNRDGMYARACALCANDYDRYKIVQKRAADIGYAESVPYEYGRTWAELQFVDHE